MKSISIVYKRSKSCNTQVKQQVQTPKRSIDEYYSKISEQQFKKQQLLERIRTQTAKAAKIRDKVRVFSSLNIHSIGTQRTIQTQAQTQRKQAYPKIKNFTTKKVENNFFTLKLPQHPQNHVVDQLKIRLQDLSKHSKLKILNKVKNIKQTTLVLSIDFILNEENFWEEENIEDNAVKTWKSIMPLANIIWLVKRQNSARKLMMFAKQSRLRLDGVVQVDAAKKETLNISYYNLQKELKLDKKNKLLIINSLKVQSLKNISDFQFKNSLPLLNHPTTFVHFVKIDMNERNRFSSILKVLTRELPSPRNVNTFFDQFENKRQNGVKRRDLRIYDDKISSEQLLEEIQRIKLKMCHQFDQSIGLTTKIEGDSVQFLIGDMLRRNYKFFNEIYSCRSPIGKTRSISKLGRGKMHNKVGKTYNRPVYFWQF